MLFLNDSWREILKIILFGLEDGPIRIISDVRALARATKKWFYPNYVQQRLFLG